MALKVLTLDEVAGVICDEITPAQEGILEMLELAAIESIEKELGYPLCETEKEYVFDNNCQDCFFIPAYNPRFTEYGALTYIMIDGVIQNEADYLLTGNKIEKCSCSCCCVCSCGCSQVKIKVQVGFDPIPPCLKLLLLNKVKDLWAIQCATSVGGDCDSDSPLKSYSVKLGPKTVTKTWDTSSNTSTSQDKVEAMFEDCLCKYRICPLVHV